MYKWKPVASVFCEGQILFNIFINDNELRDWVHLQQLWGWHHAEWCRWYTKGKGWHPGGPQQYRLRNEYIESSSARKDSEILADKKLDMRQQSAWSPESQLYLGCKKRRVILPFSFALRFVWIGHKEEHFYNKAGETLEQVYQTSCGYPMTGSFQSQVGRGFEQPNLAEDVPARGRGIGLVYL